MVLVVYGALLQVFAFVLAGSLRTIQTFSALEPSDNEVAVRTSKIFSEPNGLICGSHDVRELLTADASVSGVRNTPWPKIMAVVDAYLGTQANKISILQQEVERLQAATLKAEQEEAKMPATDQQIQDAITAALSAEGSFGSLQNAVVSKCGAEPPSVRRKLKPPVKTGAFRKCGKAFEGEAAKLFQGSVRVDGVNFRRVCDAMLSGGVAVTDVSESYCSELCQTMADTAVTQADASAGAFAGGASHQLRQQLEAKRLELQTAMHQESECNDTKEQLRGFEMQLAGLQKQIKVEFEKVQDARDALGDAEDGLLDLEEEIDVQSADAQSASRLMEAKGEAVKRAREAFERLVSLEAQAQTSVQMTKQQLVTAKTMLDNALGASKNVQAVKGMVTQTMLKMSFYFREAVLEPMRNIGLDSDTLVESYFQEDATQLAGAVAFRESMKGLGDYCEQTALPAFKTSLNKVGDLSKLCAFGGVDDAVAGVDAAVTHTMQSVKEELKVAQQWLDPYAKMNGFTRETALELVSQGEPMGLHENVAVFGKTAFFHDYLQKWKKNARKGGFLALIAELEKLVGSMETQREQLTKALKDFMLEAAELNKERLEAIKKMREAIKAHHISKERHSEALAALARQEEEAEKARERIDKLQALVDAAIKRYEDAQAELVSNFRKGTSMLQKLEELEADGPAEDPARLASAQRHEA